MTLAVSRIKQLLMQKAQKSDFLILVVSFLMFLLNLLRYPGASDGDTFEQYNDAISGKFTDWHAPMMSWLWSGFRVVVDGIGSMFVFHVFCYWLGFGLIGSALHRSGRRLAAWSAIVIATFPFFLMTNIVVLSDISMAVSLLCAFSLIFWFRSQEKPVPKPVFCLAGLFLLYAVLVRINAAFAAAPLLIYITWPRLYSSSLRFITAGIIAMVLLIISGDVFNHHVLNATKHYPERSLQIFDVTGIAHYSGDLSVLGSDNKSITMEDVSQCYKPIWWDTLSPWGNPSSLEKNNIRCLIFWNSLGTSLAQSVWSQPDHKASNYVDPHNPALAQLWLGAIAKHPVAYAEHRLAHFNSELYFIVPRHHATLAPSYNPIFQNHETEKQQPIKWIVLDWARYNFLSAPFFSYALTLLLLWLVHVDKRFYLNKNAIQALACSSVFYTGGFLIVGVATDARYQFWSLIASYLALTLFLFERKRGVPEISRYDVLLGSTALALIIMYFAIQFIEGDVLFPA